MISEEIFMQRALELAQLGKGLVSPNPLVGCVIVHEGKIIGEGWHRKFGEAHAEVNAVQSVTDKSLLPESTVYVNLEPCSHYGKTPPCADLLVSCHVKKVVIANVDTNPLVGGKGIEKLGSVGIEVLTGMLEAKGRVLNRRFFTHIEKNRPYIILKWAQTADGFISRENFESKWISNDFSRQLVHQWRSEEDAVLVGTRTAKYDNPKLNVRDWSGRNPIRIVIDRYLKLDSALHLFDGSQKTIVYSTQPGDAVENAEVVQLDEQNFILNLATHVSETKIQYVIVEGGAHTIQLFIDAGLWDEARVFESTRSFGSGISAPHLRGDLIAVQNVFEDTLKIYKNPT